jgi:hypothetical protein
MAMVIPVKYIIHSFNWCAKLANNSGKRDMKQQKNEYDCYRRGGKISCKKLRA